MPTSRETVMNKSLSGTEVKALMLADFERLLDGEGMLQSHLAYPRIAYRMTIGFQFDNPMSAGYPELNQHSREPAHNAAPDTLGMGTLATPPLGPREVCSNCHQDIHEHHVNADETWHCELDPAGDYIPVVETPELAALRLDRVILSPNAERVREGLPVTLDVKQQDGTVQQQLVHYPPDDAAGPGNVTVTDVTAPARSIWSRLDEPLP